MSSVSLVGCIVDFESENDNCFRLMITLLEVRQKSVR